MQLSNTLCIPIASFFLTVFLQYLQVRNSQKCRSR